jgi:hypothetical protein
MFADVLENLPGSGLLVVIPAPTIALESFLIAGWQMIRP